ncbi:MAG: hypothetical protein MJZ38_00815 [archaeon]|nr:hypothetical protein [archaeon]
MKVISRIPLNLDYILGLLLILTGAYTTYQTAELIALLPQYTNIILRETMSELVMIVGGIVLILLPHKNTWRTIWLCSAIMGFELLAGAPSEYDTYELYKELYSMFDFDYAFVVENFTFFLVHVGCGVALLFNALLFALRKVNSIYTIIIAILLTITIDYFTIKLQYTAGGELSIEFVESIMEFYVPHMILYGIFTIVFTSGDITWYTAKGDMWRAMNRMRTVNGIFGIHNIDRHKLILLMQNKADYSFILHQNRFYADMEVRHEGGRLTLVLGSSGTDSQASAVYINVQKILLPDTLSKSTYVDIFGEEGEHFRFNIHEPRKHIILKSVRKAQIANGIVPRFRYSVPNASLYHIVDGTGSVVFSKSKKPQDLVRLDIIDDGNGGRRAIVYRADESVYVDIPANAIVPRMDYGAYTRLYIYGDMGYYLAFKVRLPRRNQEEQPDDA